jgi:AhpD family alkylhydroperoxidase
MSAQRIEYASLAPKAYQAMYGVNLALQESSLDPLQIDLVFLRVSQINGCAFCIDKHAHDLLRLGEDFQRVNNLSSWRDTSFFSAREQAALAWAEAVTDIIKNHAPEPLFVALQENFNEQEIAELGFVIALMNAWNRIAISFRQSVAPRPRAALAI